MPYTINGIGTTYFGTWNRQVQDGVCGSCQRRGKLVNYETWHCICVLFVPLIPLGKKQVLDYCPSCSRHRVLPFYEWVKIRDQAIDETASQLSASPDDPDAALEMHATLAAFQKQDDATKLAELIESKFPDVARVQFYLAAWYERSGKPLIGNRLFLRAYELDPEDINIRRAALLTLIEEGKLDQAKSRIQPFLPGTENYEPALFYALAAGFQKQKRHEDAVQTLRMLLDASPGLISDKTFRKTLGISEKALGVEVPTIPADPFYRSAAFKWISGATAVLAAFALWNSYIASNRRVVVVNGLPMPISISVDGRSDVSVAAGGRSGVTIAEGSHEVTVKTPPDRYPAIKFEFATGWWERFVRRPMFVLDPTKSAAVLWEETTYTRVGPGEQGPEPKHELRLGEFFSSYKHIDYQFENFPDTLKMDRKTSRVVKTRLSVLPEDAAALIRRSQYLGTAATTLIPFLETHLQAAPQRDDLMILYAALSIQSSRYSECRSFVKPRLSERPVRIEWHRTYQTVFCRGLLPVEARKRHGELKQEYDNLSEREPADAALLYLRGRLEDRCSSAVDYFERSLAIDPNHPYALFALGHTRTVQGEFAAGRDLLIKAAAARPADPLIQQLLVQAQFGAGDLPALEKSARDELTKAPLSASALETLLKTLVADNRVDEADREVIAFSTRIQQIAPTEFQSYMAAQKWMLAAIKGDFESLERETKNSPYPQAAQFAFIAKLETNQLADPVGVQSAYMHLCRAMVAKRLGDAEQAQASRDSALEALDQQTDDDWAVADVLRRASDATWNEIEDLICEPTSKAVVLVTLAGERADIRTRLLDLAQKLNFDLEFPHFLLNREIADLRNQR